MRKIAKRRAKQIREYGKVRKKYLAENPICAVCGGPADQIHHKAGREEQRLLDTRYFLPVDFKCHRRIEENPEWAKEKGYTINRTTI
jgi:hypothetical protein